MGQEDVSALREVGKLLAFLKEPSRRCFATVDKLLQFKQVLNMPDKAVAWCALPTKKSSLAMTSDLNRILIATCWPEDAAPLTPGADSDARPA
ncbi:hypothetical protein OHD50_13750 [Escherichia coli]|nr:hypothetical protein [Escherichia coli]